MMHNPNAAGYMAAEQQQKYPNPTRAPIVAAAAPSAGNSLVDQVSNGTSLVAALHESLDGLCTLLDTLTEPAPAVNQKENPQPGSGARLVAQLMANNERLMAAIQKVESLKMALRL